MYKRIFLRIFTFFLLISYLGNATDIPHRLDERLANLRKGKLVLVHKEDLAVLFGHDAVKQVLIAKNVQEVEEKRERIKEMTARAAGTVFGLMLGVYIAGGMILFLQ